VHENKTEILYFLRLITRRSHSFSFTMLQKYFDVFTEKHKTWREDTKWKNQT